MVMRKYGIVPVPFILYCILRVRGAANKNTLLFGGITLFT